MSAINLLERNVALKELARAAMENTVSAIEAIEDANRLGDRVEDLESALEIRDEIIKFLKSEIYAAEEVLEEAGLFPVDPTESLEDRIRELVVYIETLEWFWDGPDALYFDALGVLDSDQELPNVENLPKTSKNAPKAKILVDLLRNRTGRADPGGLGDGWERK